MCKRYHLTISLWVNYASAILQKRDCCYSFLTDTFFWYKDITVLSANMPFPHILLLFFHHKRSSDTFSKIEHFHKKHNYLVYYTLLSFPKIKCPIYSKGTLKGTVGEKRGVDHTSWPYQILKCFLGFSDILKLKLLLEISMVSRS